MRPSDFLNIGLNGILRTNIWAAWKWWMILAWTRRAGDNVLIQSVFLLFCLSGSSSVIFFALGILERGDHGECHRSGCFVRCEKPKPPINSVIFSVWNYGLNVIQWKHRKAEFHSELFILSIRVSTFLTRTTGRRGVGRRSPTIFICDCSSR